MIFLVAITVVAEIADIAGVFDVAGHWAARLGRHRTPLLWLLLVLLSCLATIVLSLDTTAVLLTPVVIAVARQLGLSAVPFVMTTVWLANTASLLLPVSNLTNLLALHHFSLLGLGSAGYLRLALWPALASIAATVVVLAVLHRRSLRGRYELDAPPEPHDRVLLLVAGAVCVALGPAFVSGVTPAIPATIAAVVLAVVLGVRSRGTLRTVKVPVADGPRRLRAVRGRGRRRPARANALLTSWVGDGTTGADLLRLSGIGAVSANAVNNLPAYLALEPVASADPQRLMALLIGVNCGPLVTIWASLATILWRERCRKGGVEVSVGTLAWQGALCAVASIGAAVAALTWLAPLTHARLLATGRTGLPESGHRTVEFGRYGASGRVARARWRSSTRSRTSSRPTETRRTPSVMPTASRASSPIRRWVVVAGWVIRDLESPRLLEMSMTCRAFISGEGRVLAAVHLEGDDRAAAVHLGLGQLVLRVRLQPRVDHARDLRAGLQRPRQLQGRRGLLLHPQRQGLHALEQDPGVERRHRRAGVAHQVAHRARR